MTDYQIAILRGDNSDIILKKKLYKSEKSYLHRGSEIQFSGNPIAAGSTCG